MARQPPASKAKFYTLPEAAEILRCDKETVRRLLNTGELKGIKVGGLTAPWRIRSDWLDEWVEYNIYNPTI